MSSLGHRASVAPGLSPFSLQRTQLLSELTHLIFTGERGEPHGKCGEAALALTHIFSPLPFPPSRRGLAGVPSSRGLRAGGAGSEHAAAEQVLGGPTRSHDSWLGSESM